MIEQQGLVIRSQPGRVWLRLGAETGCSACDNGQGCGAGVFGKLLKREPVEIAIDTELDFKVGTAALAGISEGQFLTWVFGLFALPLLTGIAGAAVSHYMVQFMTASSTVIDLATLIGGLVSGGLVLKLFAGRLNSRLTGMELVLLEKHQAGLTCGSVERNSARV